MRQFIGPPISLLCWRCQNGTSLKNAVADTDAHQLGHDIPSALLDTNRDEERDSQISLTRLRQSQLLDGMQISL